MPSSINVRVFIVVLLFSTLILSGCKLLREVREVAAPGAMEAETVVDNLQKNQLDYTWFSARFTGSVAFDNGRNNISGSLRIKRDSAIFISIAPVLGIEVFRALITRDSVKFLNRMEATYFTGGIEKLNALVNSPLDFYMLQALFTGNDFSNFASNRFVLTETAGTLLIQDPARRKFHSVNTLNHSLIIDPAKMKIKTNIIKENNQNRSLRVDYLSHEKINEQWVPNELKAVLADRSAQANLSLGFSRITLNQPQRIDFVVPDKYTPLDF